MSSLDFDARAFGALAAVAIALGSSPASASIAFTSAGLSCSHHANLALFGGGAPDAVACAAGMLAAATTGALRIVADRHYASDVLVGAAVGSMSGLLLPWALHYRIGAQRTPPQGDAKRVSWAVIPTPSGASVMGQF